MKRRATLRKFGLRLFLTGATARSARALDNIQRLCEAAIPGDYDLKVIDIYQQPALARAEQILAAPTLIKTRPGRPCRLIGDMSDEAMILFCLGIEAHAG